MQKLTISEIISKIEAEETFHAVSSDYSFTLKIDNYVPYVCAAVHDGHQFRKDLWGNCLHTEFDRWYEEDPETKNMVATHSIVIAGCDSRFEYDLNRAPETAIYTDAWGKQLWKNPLPKKMHEKSMQKHTNFYKVVHALIAKLEDEYLELRAKNLGEIKKLLKKVLKQQRLDAMPTLEDVKEGRVKVSEETVMAIIALEEELKQNLEETP